MVDQAVAAGDLVRAVQSADKALIAAARVFDVYAGPGVPAGSKSLALEVTVQPRDHTLAEAEIEALSNTHRRRGGKGGRREASRLIGSGHDPNRPSPDPSAGWNAASSPRAG